MENINKRIRWIDIAKGFGILIIVLGHVLRVGYLKQFTYAFSVPYCLILAGFTYKYNNSSDFIRKKFLRIMIPYYSFSLISIIIYYFVGTFFQNIISLNQSDTNILNNILSMFYANSRYLNMEWNRPLWFLPTFFISIVLVNFIENYVNKGNKRAFFIIVLLFINFIVSLFSDVLYLPFQLETAFSFMLYIEIGILIKDLLYENKNSALIIIGIVIGCALGYINGSSDIRIMEFGRSYFLYLLVSIILSISFIMLSKKISKLNLLALIGRNTISIMCMHKFPVMFFQMVLPITKAIILKNSETLLMDFTSIALSVIVVCMCLGVTYLLNMYFPYIYGTNKKTNILKQVQYE